MVHEYPEAWASGRRDWVTSQEIKKGTEWENTRTSWLGRNCSSQAIRQAEIKGLRRTPGGGPGSGTWRHEEPTESSDADALMAIMGGSRLQGAE